MLERKHIDNNVYDLTKAFAVRIVKLYNFLCNEKKEFVMSKQLLRCGTSIGANVAEGRNAQTRPDFITKMNIALKEASESLYWIDLLHDTEYLNDTQFESINNDCGKIVAVLTKIVKSTKDQQTAG